MIGAGAAAAAGLAAATVGGFAARAASPRLGAMDQPEGALKPHERAVGFLGGFAVALGLATGFALRGWPVPWGVSAALGGALLIGLADDYLDVAPLVRLTLQLVIGLLLAAGGVTASAVPGQAAAWIVGAVLFAAAANAVNMVDGIDGLAGGTAALSALGLALIAARAGHDGPAVIALVTAAAAAGFLAHNLSPARLFLGDNGAYLLAAALAVVVLAEGRTWASLLGAGTCFGIFGVDLLLSVLRRAVGRSKLTSGDRLHLYDQMLARGLTPGRTLLVCWTLHLAIIVAGMQAARLTTAAAVASVAGVWLVVVVWLAWSGFVGATE